MPLLLPVCRVCHAHWWCRLQMAPGQLERVVSGGSEGSGGQLARTNSHYMGPVGSEALTQHWVQHAWGDAGHVMNRCWPGISASISGKLALFGRYMLQLLSETSESTISHLGRGSKCGHQLSTGWSAGHLSRQRRLLLQQHLQQQRPRPQQTLLQLLWPLELMTLAAMTLMTEKTPNPPAKMRWAPPYRSVAASRHASSPPGRSCEIHHPMCGNSIWPAG